MNLTGLSTLEVLGLPEVRAVDLVQAPADRQDELIAELAQIHLEHFGDYPHVLEEWRQWRSSGTWAVPDSIGHAFLLVHRDQPIGELLIDLHPDSGVALIHFIAVRAPARRSIPGHSMRKWVRFYYDVVAADCRELGVPFVAVAGEVSADVLDLFTSFGFDKIAEDYAEPRHGMHWADFGEPEFIDQELVMLRPPDSSVAAASAAVAVVERMCLAHYRLPDSHPRVVEWLARAAKQRLLPPAIAAAARQTILGDPASL